MPEAGWRGMPARRGSAFDEFSMMLHLQKQGRTIVVGSMDELEPGALILEVDGVGKVAVDRPSDYQEFQAQVPAEDLSAGRVRVPRDEAPYYYAVKVIETVTVQ